jgi:hypothetical protein
MHPTCTPPPRTNSVYYQTMRHAAGCADGCAITTSRASDWRRKHCRRTFWQAARAYTRILGILCTAAGIAAAPLAHGGTCVIDVRDARFRLRSLSGEHGCKRPHLPLPILAAIQWRRSFTCIGNTSMCRHSMWHGSVVTGASLSCINVPVPPLVTPQHAANRDVEILGLRNCLRGGRGWKEGRKEGRKGKKSM